METGAARLAAPGKALEAGGPGASAPKVQLEMLRRLGRLGRALGHAARTVEVLHEGGAPYLKQSLARKLRSRVQYRQWVETYDTLDERDRGRIRARLEALAQGDPPLPRFSVVMPVYAPNPVWLREAIASVRAQLYGADHWELCIADDASPSDAVRSLLASEASRDKRIRLVCRESNGGIAAATNSALELATGDYVVFLDHDDRLAEHALYCMAEEILAHPEAALLYSDEDKLASDGRRFRPHFKSDWSPDLMYCFNLVTHLACYRVELLDELGGMREGYDGSQDYDLALRAYEAVGSQAIRHVPHVLYHWRAALGSTSLGPEQKPAAYEGARRAIRDHLSRCGIEAEVEEGYKSFHRVRYRLPTPAPTVSIIIPTRDQPRLLGTLMRGLLDGTRYPSFDVLIIDNGSQSEAARACLQRLAKDSRVRVLRCDEPFHFARLNNLAAANTQGELLAFLNDDLEVMSENWLEEMVRHALRPDVGAVGAKLYYPTKQVQHAGVVLGVGGIAGHAHRGLPRAAPGEFGRAQVTQEVSAVTGACMLTRREVFDALGGFDEAFAVAYNDIDYCLRAKGRGYRIIFTPEAELGHAESASRGSDYSETTRPRFESERRKMMERWGPSLRSDPFYNPNLTLIHEDFSLGFPPRAVKAWRAL